MKVSVAITAYNHEKYIAAALDGALGQQAGFDWEIVIGEDCSTDGTRRIVADYAAKHPRRIQAILHPRNVGMNRNFAATIEACRGQYIALLDGDDYWTSPDKLQRQADFLDGHPECATCFHDARVVFEDGRGEPFLHCGPAQKPFSDLADLLAGNFIPTCGAMFRSGLCGPLPQWFFEQSMGDWPLHILNAQFGRIGYINEVMGVYRIHAGGAWSMRSEAWKHRGNIEVYEALDSHLHGRYGRQIRQHIGAAAFELARICETEGDMGQAAGYALRCLRSGARGGAVSRAEMVRILLRHCMPGPYCAARAVKNAIAAWRRGETEPAHESDVIGDWASVWK